MSYTFTLGSLHVIPNGSVGLEEEYDCKEAKDGCAPSFVFSIAGQVGFRSALDHLTDCQKQHCRSLRARLHRSMRVKLQWLLEEECLLGCVIVQPQLYGSRRVVLKPGEFSAVARHLSRCPKESCAQLRRALLLTIRDEMRPH